MEQLACLNRAVEYVQLSDELETRFMAAVKRMKQAFLTFAVRAKISPTKKRTISISIALCALSSLS